MTCETRRCFGHNWPPLATRRWAKCLVESGAFASESHRESAVDALCRRTGQCNFPALYFLKPRKFNSSTLISLDPFSGNMPRRELATIKGTQTLHHSLLAELGTQWKPRGDIMGSKHPMQTSKDWRAHSSLPRIHHFPWRSHLPWICGGVQTRIEF